ncbi:MAG: hypothetical protein U0736_04790 [Gemmataceae bacterium]
MSGVTGPVGPRGRPAVAWAVIAAAVAVVLWRNAGPPAVGGIPRWLVPLQIQARYVVGAARLGLPGADPAEMYRTAERLLRGRDYPQRLRLATVAGELAGPAQAREDLAALEADRRKPAPSRPTPPMRRRSPCCKSSIPATKKG